MVLKIHTEERSHKIYVIPSSKALLEVTALHATGLKMNKRLV
jgi:hypothetical protein